MAIKELKIKRFDLGMTDCEEDRDVPEGQFRYLENVTVGLNRTSIKQVPNTVATSNQMGLTRVLEIGGAYYGLGESTDGSKVTLWTYSGTWSATTPGTNLSPTHSKNLLFCTDGTNIYFYNKDYIAKGSDYDWGAASSSGIFGGIFWQTYLWGWSSSNQIFKWDSAGTPTATITMPADQTIVDIIDYGNLLAILCNSTNGEAKMFLWDGVNTSSLPFYDIIKIGKGSVKGGAIVDGVITVVIGGVADKDFRIKQYTGNTFRTAYYYAGRENSSGAVNTIICSTVKEFKGYIYFLGFVSRPDTTDTYATVMFRFGQKTQSEPYSFCIYKNLDFIPTNKQNTLISDFTITDVPGNDQDYANVLAVVQDTTSTFATKQITSGTGFTDQPGIIDTSVYTLDSSINKQLMGVSAQYKGLSGSGVIVYYKADTETTWTQIFTDATADSISHEAVNVESTGAILPTFKEIWFRIKIYGNNLLTGFKFKWQEEHNAYGD